MPDEVPADVPDDVPAEVLINVPQYTKTYTGKPRSTQLPIQFTSFNEMTPERAREIQSLGGKTPSIKRDNAKRVANLKKWAKAGKLNSERINWLIERMENREVMFADIANYIDDIREACHPSQRIALVNAMNQTARFMHGDKVHTENVNLNINTTLEEWERRMREE
jgi:hypothetical protein